MYIGEWHTHPEYSPMYSSIDFTNWITICEENDKKDFQYHIIAGINYISIWKILKTNKSIIDVYKESWKNLEWEPKND